MINIKKRPAIFNITQAGQRVEIKPKFESNKTPENPNNRKLKITKNHFHFEVFLSFKDVKTKPDKMSKELK